MKRNWKTNCLTAISIMSVLVFSLLPSIVYAEDTYAEDTAVVSTEENEIEAGNVYDTGSSIPYISDSNIEVSSYGSVVTSYLLETEDGYMRVEYMGTVRKLGWENAVIIEYYDKDFHMVNQKKVYCELSEFGGFFEGDDAYYVVYGEDNYDEDDDAEVIRVVKYSKTWERQGSTSIYAKTSDANSAYIATNITSPFSSGSLRMAECDGYLYIHTCKTAYMTIDGLRHQGAFSIEIRESDMQVTDQSTNSNTHFSSASHSFDQYVLVDDDANLITLDQCDSSPSRGFLLYKIETAAGSGVTGKSRTYLNVFPCQSTGSNNICARPGGLEYSDSSYIVAGRSVTQDENALEHTAWNAFVTVTPRDNFTADETTIKWMTDFDTDGEVSVTATKLVKISSDKFLFIWSLNTGELQYVFLDGKGDTVSEIFTGEANLSDCQPIVSEGNVIWYVSEEKNPYFYVIDVNGNLSKYYDLTSISGFTVYLLGYTGFYTQSFTYTGSEITPDVVVTDCCNNVLEQGTDYTITSYSNNTNAGTASVTITGMGDYTGELVRTYTINKASQPIYSTLQSDTISVGETTTLSLTRNPFLKGDVSFSSSDTDIAIVDDSGNITGIGEGSASITVAVSETDNYAGNSATYMITVTESSDTGAGDTGSGDTDTGDTDTGDTGSGDTGTGDAGSGDTDTGDAGSSDTGTEDAGSDDSGSGSDSNDSGDGSTGESGTADSSTDSTAGDTLMVRRGNTCYFNYTLKGGNADFSITAGRTDDTVLVGDWDGDGVDSICLRRGNTCYFVDDITTMNVYLTVTYGRATDEVLVGDWDGDGCDSLAMRRNGNIYYFCNDITAPDADTWSASYGRAADEVIVGDWEDKGYDSLAVRRNGNVYYFSLSKVTDPDGDVWKTTFGRAGDEVLVGDWDADGTDTLAMRRNGNTYFISNSIANPDSGVDRFTFGRASDTVYAGKWK